MEWWVSNPLNILTLPLIYVAGFPLEILVDGWKTLGSLKVWVRLMIYGFGIWAISICLMAFIPELKDTVLACGNVVEIKLVSAAAIFCGAFGAIFVPIAAGVEKIISIRKQYRSLQDRANDIWRE